MKKTLYLICTMCMLSFMLIGCGKEKNQKDQEIISVKEDSEKTTDLIESEKDSETVFSTDSISMNEPADIGKPLEIETPYVNLHYPEKWEGFLTYVQETVDEGLVVEFYGSVNDQEELLYMILFGIETENSFQFGTISGEFGQVKVSVEISDFVPDENWSQEDADRICAMQESVNYIMEKLEENVSFSSN